MTKATMQRNITVPISAIHDELVDLFITHGWVKPGEVSTISSGKTHEGPTLFVAMNELALDKQEGGA